MRVLLIHNPKAGDGKHNKKQLMASLARCGHQAFYQSRKVAGWKKAFKKPVDLVIVAGGDGTVHKTAWQLLDSGIPLAILLIIGGIFSFLPVLGLWMLPLGLVLFAQDVPPLQKPMAKGLGWIERKWLERERAKLERERAKGTL